MLLAVFVPMLLLSSLHHHEPAPAEQTACYSCLHHLPHGGHLSSQAGEMPNCVLCHFLSLPFVAGTGLVCFVSSFVRRLSAVVRQPHALPGCGGVCSLRAPPCCQ